MNYVGRNTIRSRNRIIKKVPRNRKKPNYALLFSLFFSSIALTGGLSYAFRTPVLAISHVRILGVRLCDKGAVQRLADCAKGQNILLLKKTPILKSVSGLSEVRSVKMGRSFPNGVWVCVVERKPDAVMLADDHYYLVQADGLVFHQASGVQKDIPLIIVPKYDKIKIGERVEGEAVRYALDTLTCARKEGLKLDKISVDPQGDICLNMGSDFYVKLGQPDDIQRKMSLLKNTLVYRPSIARKAAYVDLSCPSAPVWKPKMVAGVAS